MRIRKRRLALAGAGLALGSLMLAACSHAQPSLGEYAIVTGHGLDSNQEVQQVVQPGVSYTTGSGTTTWYVPAQIRNYVTGNGGDRAAPQAELTGVGPGKEDAMSDLTYTSVYFEVNPAIGRNLHNWNFAKKFLSFCLKYACADDQAQNDTGNAGQAHSADPGWNNMLGELFPHAIDNATLLAMPDFPPGLWNTRGDWPKLAADIQKHLPAELSKMTGDVSSIPYFCGPGSTFTKCAPMTVIVNDVTPSDPGVQSEYQSQQTAIYAEKAAQQELAAAKAKYGPDAYWTLAMIDIVKQCQASGGTVCYIDGNQAPIHP